MTKSNPPSKRSRSTPPLRLGFLPENDCAPAAVAREFDYFTEHGLAVELHRHNSCASLRDHLVNGLLDAAIAPATLPFVLTLGLDFEHCACVSGLVTSLQGNALTVSRQLYDKGVRDAATLRERIFKDWGKRTYTFGVIFPYSPQYFLLCQWLRAAGLVPHSHVRIVVIPPEQMFPTMELGYLDGFCVGEPWTSVAVASGAGVALATSVQLAPLHPEKALVVRAEFAAQNHEAHEHLIAALIEAGQFCERPDNCDTLGELLARPEYVNAPPECIRPGLAGPFTTHGRRVQNLRGLNVFAAHHANEPSDARVDWIANHLWRYVHGGGASNDVRRPSHILRQDIYRAALKRLRPAPSARKAGRRCVPPTEALCANA